MLLLRQSILATIFITAVLIAVQYDDDWDRKSWRRRRRRRRRRRKMTMSSNAATEKNKSGVDDGDVSSRKGALFVHQDDLPAYIYNEHDAKHRVGRFLDQNGGNDDGNNNNDDDASYNNNDDNGQNGDDVAAQDNDDNNDDNQDNEEENQRNSRDEGLKLDDKIYIDDDYDEYYAFQEDRSDIPHLLPLRPNDIIGFFIASIGVMLSAGGGIGGGGIVVPAYILVMKFAPREAIPLSAVTVFGGAMASTMMNLRRRHPLADRPVIDWNLVLIMEPLILVGAMVGSVLHRILSEKLLVVLLVALLSITAHTTLAKAKQMWEAEKIYIERLQNHLVTQKVASVESHNYHPPMPPTDSSHGVRTLQTGVRQQILILNPDFVSVRSDLLEGEKVTPRSKIIALCSMFSVLIFLNIMVGGGAFQSPWGIRCASLPFWVVHIIIAAFLIASAWAAQTYLVNQHEMKELINFDYVHGDLKFDSKGAIIYPLIFCFAGLFAGIFGIGGGMICVPMLLGMGVHPLVATATSSCMILFTSFASTTSFAIFDLLFWDYAVVCLIVGFFPTLLGQSLMAQARYAGKINGQNFERYSIIAYSIGGVVLLSALLMTIQYVFSIVSLDEPNDSGGLCEGYQRGY